MNKKSLAVILIYFLAGIAELFFFYGGIKQGLWISQGLLMPLLMTYYLINANNFRIRHHKWIIAAIVSAWLGDITLMFSPEYPFMVIPGLAGFLVMQGLYIRIFFIGPVMTWKSRGMLTASIICIIYGAIFYIFLYPLLNDMKLPVLIYNLALITTLITAIGRKGKVASASYILVLTGVILFVISDSFIALTLFYKRFLFSEMMIGIPYFTAQFLIIRGLLLAQKHQHHTV